MYHRKNSFTLIFCAFILLNLLHFTSYGQKTWKLDVEGNVRDEDSKEVDAIRQSNFRV